MRVVRREIELSFKFTLGPGDPSPDENDAMAQLMALARRCNSPPAPEPKPLKREYHLCQKLWRCDDCPSHGLTLRGSVLHRNAFPLHVVEFPDSGLEG